MRKLLNTCVLVFAFCLCGCSDDEVTTPGLKVLSTTAKFNAFGGEGKIEVQSPVAITAVSEEDWCTVSVSGQTVNVTVPVNETITGRTAMVAITAGDETLRVPVYQAGDAFICDLSDYRFPIGGGSRTFSLKTVRIHDVSVEAPEWLKYKIQDEEIVFTADPAENDRFARVAVTNGISSVTAVFRQWSVEGTYTLSFVDRDTVQKSGTAVVVKKNGDIYDVTTTDMVVNATIKASYSEETSRMVISLGQELGQVKTDNDKIYTVKLCALSSDKGLSLSSDIQYVADVEFDKATGKVRFEFKDNGTWPGHEVVGFVYVGINPESGHTEGNFGSVSNLVMTKQ